MRTYTELARLPCHGHERKPCSAITLNPLLTVLSTRGLGRLRRFRQEVRQPQLLLLRKGVPYCGVPSCSAMPKERLPGLPNCFLPILCCVCNPHLFVHYHTIHFGSSAFMGGQLWAFPRGATTHHIWLS